MEKSLVIREDLSPAEVVQGATNQAKLLMDIVLKTGCFQEISGKKYLQVEAWETIGAFNRTHAETESVIPITKDNETVGYQAKVQLWQDGAVIGGAIMPCYFTENCCKGKEGDAKHKASMSAAQTFATSKAYRMNFSYVAILAGYQPLPAEELTADMQDKAQHWCKEHDTQFFMRGKMKSYAHPIGDTGDWCYEHKEKPEAAKPQEGGDVKTGHRLSVDKVEAPHTGTALTKTEPEKEKKPGKSPPTSAEKVGGEPTIPKTMQELCVYVAAHGKYYNKTWLLRNVEFTEEKLKEPANIEKAYHELKEMAGWDN